MDTAEKKLRNRYAGPASYMDITPQARPPAPPISMLKQMYAVGLAISGVSTLEVSRCWHARPNIEIGGWGGRARKASKKINFKPKKKNN